MRKDFKETIKSNIALIGMAGVGKSFIGKHLAEKIGYDYIEADKLIDNEAGRIGTKKEQLTDDEFIRLEERVIIGLSDKRNAVIDTGGSAIYSKKAMESLKSNAIVIYLRDSAENTKKRFDARGKPHLVKIGEKSFGELFQERNGLYEKYSNITVNASDNNNLQDILDEISLKIKSLFFGKSAKI
jgi:shikimate kinase